eukprot:630583-Rhodomonas_salina.1
MLRRQKKLFLAYGQTQKVDFGGKGARKEGLVDVFQSVHDIEHARRYRTSTCKPLVNAPDRAARARWNELTNMMSSQC